MSGRVPSGRALTVPVEPASSLAPSGFDPSRDEITNRIAGALALAPHLEANTAGELLRELCFRDGYGCYSSFDLVDGFDEVAPRTLSLPIRTALGGCWAKDRATVKRMTGYFHKETRLVVAWYWDGDGTLVFKRGPLFLYNTDCKKDHEWKSSSPDDWIHTYSHYEESGGNYPLSDSDGNPKGGDGTAPSQSDDSADPKGIAQ